MEQSAGYVCPPQEQPVADEVCLRAYETCSTKQKPYHSYFSSSETKSIFWRKAKQRTRFRPNLIIWIIYCDLKFSSKINWKVQDLIVLNQTNLLINLYLRINIEFSKPSWITQTPSTILITGQVTRYQVEFQLIKIYTEIGTMIKIIHVIAPEITHFSFNTNLLSKNIINPRIWSRRLTTPILR